MNTAALIVYALTLVLILLAPFAPWRERTDAASHTSSLGPLGWVGIFIATILFAARSGAVFPLTPLMLLPLARSGRNALAGSAVALMLFAAAIWWNPYSQNIPVQQWVAFAILGLAIPALWHFSKPSKPSANKAVRLYSVSIFLLALLLGLFVGFYTAPFNARVPALTAWHHWGAYLSPVELLLSGGVPYQDFPIQYGIGPTLLLAANCGDNCWNGMFQVVLVTNALYFAVLVACVSILARGAPKAKYAIAMIAMFCAAFIWTAFPSNLGATMATPSVAGLRFLPLAALLLFVLQREDDRNDRLALGHAIWAFNVFWSIEAAAFACLLWWPWLAYRQQKEGALWQAVVLGWLRYAFFGAVSLTLALLALLLLYRGYFAKWPEAQSIFAYIQHPPGFWPLDPHGSIWFVLMVALIAIVTLANRTAKRSGMLYACSISCVAAFSYFLSRSHDNNILNLLPFLLLVIFCVIDWQAGVERKTQFGDGFAGMVPMAVIVFATLVNLSEWTSPSEKADGGNFGGQVLLQRLDPGPETPNALLTEDALALLDEAHKSSASAPLWFDKFAVMPVAGPRTAWTSINNIANYSPLPVPLVKAYIKSGAKRFRRSGWLIVEDGRYRNWPKYFAVAYDVKPIRRRGRYTAYFLTPLGDK